MNQRPSKTTSIRHNLHKNTRCLFKLHPAKAPLCPVRNLIDEGPVRPVPDEGRRRQSQGVLCRAGAVYSTVLHADRARTLPPRVPAKRIPFARHLTKKQTIFLRKNTPAREGCSLMLFGPTHTRHKQISVQNPKGACILCEHSCSQTAFFAVLFSLSLFLSQREDDCCVPSQFPDKN